MKRLACAIAALLVAFLIFGLTVGCGDDGEETTTTGAPQTTQATGAPQTTQASTGPTESVATTLAPLTEVIELKMAASAPTPKDNVFILLEEWADRIEQETNGMVKITNYTAGTLVGQLEIFDAVLGGVADIANGPAGWAPARFGLSSFGGNCLHRLPSAQVATTMLREIAEGTPEIQAEWAGLKVLWINGQTPGQFHLAKRAETLADLNGRQIRCPGDLSPWISALGATPVSMPTADIYMAMQKGILDGAFAGPAELEQLRLAEVAPFTLKIPVVTGTFVSVMTDEKWNSLPDAAKAAIESASAWAAGEISKRWDDASASAYEFAKTLGHEGIDPAPEEMTKILDLLYAANQTVADSFEKDGKPAAAVMRAAQEAEQRHAADLLFPDYQP
ncbi:MAG: TRAP transporter substrate-binding protein DctP [Armatimonadetes bacterium]|nr:TRAP transporter substrate-binding protein DctP [Armatimonadota bacterium]